MKNNEQIIRVLTVVVISTIFTACGSNGTVEGLNGTSYEEISISKACTSPDTISDYITLKSGDQIVKDDEGTEISILQDEEAVKKVCLISGTAHINRAIVE